MGVPKFFRWISERYPKINQPIHAPPNPETKEQYFPTSAKAKENDEASKSKSKSNQQDSKVYIQKNSIIPEFDRLYLDMNGIIHCASHNNASDDNATIDPDTHIENDGPSSSATATTPPTEPTSQQDGTVEISEDEIFRNVCYYVDRVITDIAQPKELVYMAIDGVAPRAKMNQQRSRRYRSGKEREIEKTFYAASMLKQRKERELQKQLEGQESRFDSYNESDDDFNFVNMDGEYEYTRDNISRSMAKDVNINVNTNVDDDNDDDGDNMKAGDLKEVEPGRFTGKFETSGKLGESSTDNLANIPAFVDGKESVDIFDQDYDAFIKTIQASEDKDLEISTSFHSNTITPGTPFFERCTEHLHHFIKRKLHTDPRWAHLTIIFSGPRTPGEGEHKIMDFIRNQKHKKDYNPNTRHCLFGQDGDLIMLGLATHEPHFCLLREEVIFDQSRKKANLQMLKDAREKMLKEEANAEDIAVTSQSVSASIDSYIHNSNFEVLHMSVLRDYLAYEFETKDVIPKSPFDLEQTIDDFVFMTFFVGNDFLPHMPAIDIADEAFDLLFYTYKRNRWGWLRGGGKGKGGNNGHPYLTNAGEIVSGKRLETFLSYLGKHESPYYDNKQRSLADDNQRMRKADEKAGRDSSVPPDDILAAREEWERANYKEMLKSIATQQQDLPTTADGFTPVASQREIFNELETMKDSNDENYEFKPETSEDEELEEGFVNRMGTLFRNSLSSSGEEIGGDRNASPGSVTHDVDAFDEHVQDIKGRYYYDKFKFSPLDAEKHIALRKAYIEGLVWNLQYYYKGCVSWDWYYPYHYGPMVSDLKDINKLLRQISFKQDKSEPLQPFEQLMANLPPSSAKLLPKPYQWLMKSQKSPIVDFYPESFTVDMNGKRWPWEAVVLLPFIDADRLISASRGFVTPSILSENEKHRNQVIDAVVYSRDTTVSEDVPALNEKRNFGALAGCNVREQNFNSTQWRDVQNESNVAFRPRLLPGTIVPYPGFPSLKDAPVQALKRRKLGINVFGMRSRYKTAILEMNSDIPMIASAETLAEKFVGTTLHFRYPFLQEGFVTALSDAEMTVRGKDTPRKWSQKEKQMWELKNDTIRRQYATGEGLTGSGGWDIPKSSVTLSVRPLKEIQTLSDGRKVKVYARLEVEVPFIAALWSPTQPDPRFADIPARLEKNPYRFGSEPKSSSFGLNNISTFKKGGKKARRNFLPSKKGNSNIFGDISGPKSHKSASTNALPPPMSNAFQKNMGNSKGFCTLPLRGDRIATNTAQMRISRQMKIPSIKSRPIGAIAIAAMAFLCKEANSEVFRPSLLTPSNIVHKIVPRGGGATSEWQNSLFDDNEQNLDESKTVPPLEFAHGTTTLSFTFDGGIVAAVDSRASIGNFVGSKTTQKVLPISDHILGTMAGGAADCSFWIRRLQAESRHHALSEGKPISVARVARVLADYLYENKGSDLSVGTMIMGFDEYGSSIYYVDNTGCRLKGDLFSVGSGSTFALGVLDSERKESMNEKEAIALGIKAIRHATFRDAFSGGYIAIYVIKESGWTKVFSEDLASIDKA